jgi:hypothetical protein
LGYSEIDKEQKMQEIKTYSEGTRDWLVKETDAYIIDHIANMVQYSQSIKANCQIHKINYFDVSRNFSPTLDEAVRYLLAP